MKRRFMLSLLVASLTLLAGCNDAPKGGFCPASVRADQCTKDWLLSVEVPACALDYLNRVGKQQKAIEKNCEAAR